MHTAARRKGSKEKRVDRASHIMHGAETIISIPWSILAALFWTVVHSLATFRSSLDVDLPPVPCYLTTFAYICASARL